MVLLRRLALTAAGATYLLIVVGAVVRVTGSGMGCGPDWPLCQGRLFPPLEWPALIEYAHRVLGALVSGLMLALTVTAWLTRRGERTILVPAILIPLLVPIQIGLGAIVVKLDLAAMAVVVHLGFALVILGLLTWLAVWSLPAPRVLSPSGVSTSARVVPSAIARLVSVVAALVFVLILSGAYMRASGASWACAGFPTCNGQPLPFGASLLVDIHLAHRLLAYSTAWLVSLAVFEIVRSCRAPALRSAALALGVLVLAQVAIGAVTVSTGPRPLLQGLHVAGATAVWASMVVLAALVARCRAEPAHTGGVGTATLATSSGLRAQQLPRDPSRVPEAAAHRSLGTMVAAFLELTKPRVVALLLITTLASMMVAAGGLPALSLVFFTLLGGALAAGGAGAINHYLDRDIDQLMSRTSVRPIPSGTVSPRQALLFGSTLGALSFVVLSVFVNLLSAALSLGALLFYVFVYTRWLKRSTPSNIVIGGAAGAVPPLVGSAAVTGEITLLALYLFAIVFFWTPPHFWALALVMRREYERARVPMLPIVRGEAEARRQILFYSLQLVALTVVLFSFQLMGLFYLFSALVLGGMFIFYAVRLWRQPTVFAARRLFRYSIVYLTLLFTAMVVDRQMIL
jgi:protoheme IX farnesyltransferase